MTTGAATLASGANYLLVSGLKPRGRLGKRLMIQRENLQERYREREVLVREKMGVGRERMRVGRERMRVRQVRVAGSALLVLCRVVCGFCASPAVLMLRGHKYLRISSPAVQFLPQLCRVRPVLSPSRGGSLLMPFRLT